MSAAMSAAINALLVCATHAVPHADDRKKTVFEWVVTSEDDFVAGGYCASRADAANDLRIWRESNLSPFSTIYWRALTPDNRDFNFLTEAKARAFAKGCDGAFIGRATVAEMNDILRRAGVLRKGKTCK